MAASIQSYLPNIARPYVPLTRGTLNHTSFALGGVGRLSLHKSTSQIAKWPPRVMISCVSEAQRDSCGKCRDGRGSVMAAVAWASVAQLLFPHLKHLVSPVIEVIKASFVDQLKRVQLHSVPPVHIAVALGLGLAGLFTLVNFCLFISYLLAGNRGTGTSPVVSVGNMYFINKAIWMGNGELPLPQDKASSGPVDAVKNCLGLSPEKVVQILRILIK